MARGGGIALLDRGDGSLDEAFEQLFDVLIEAAVFVGDGGLRGKRKRQPDRAFGKWPHFAGDDFRARQARFGMKFAVDQLQDADDLAAAILHGKRQQGPRSVSGFLVVAPVEAVGTAARNAVGIGQIDHFAVHRRIAGQGIFAQRKLEFGKGKLHAVVLRQLETKMALARAGGQSVRARLLNQVKRAGIRARDLAGLRENHFEQRPDFVRFATRRCRCDSVLPSRARRA